jgi:hypothetical protein
MQADFKPRNRRERIFNRAFNHHARAGRIETYTRFVQLGLEAHTIRDASDWRDVLPVG